MAMPTTLPGVRAAANTPFLSINGVDLSAYVRAASFRAPRTEEEDAASGQAGYAEYHHGREAPMLDVTMMLDFYTATVYPTLKALYAAAAGQAIIYGPRGNDTGKEKFTFTGKLSERPVDDFHYDTQTSLDVTILVHGAYTEAAW